MRTEYVKNGFFIFGVRSTFDSSYFLSRVERGPAPYTLGISKNLLSRSGDLLTQLGSLIDYIDPADDTVQIDWADLKRQERASNLIVIPLFMVLPV